MAEELLQKLIDIVTTTAPELWRIAIREAFVTGIRMAALGVFLIIASIVTWRTAKRFDLGYKAARYDEERYGNDEEIPYAFAYWICVIASALTAVAGTINVYQSTAYLLNPEFHAIKVLISLVK